MEIIRLDNLQKTHHRDELAIPDAGALFTSEHSAVLMNDKYPNAKPRIAIVDDDPGMRRFLARVLRSTGFSTVTYESGEAFLREQLREPSVCVLLDLSMPGISGFEVKDRLAKSHPNVPVILITGQTDPALGIIAQQKGFTACLAKPLDPPLLLSAIRQALGGT
jgi:FixJ family two-component response regulator